MGDITLTPRRTAGILKELEHAAKSVGEARRELIQAMSERKRAADPDRPVRRSISAGASRRKLR